MNNFYFFILFTINLISLALYAENSSKKETLVVETAHAIYDGKTITFNGNVKIKHGLGNISSRHVEIKPQIDENKIEKGILTLLGDVSINLREGGYLDCAKARLDFRSNVGIFEGDVSKPEVVYFKNHPDKSKPNISIPVLFKSKKMTVEIDTDNTAQDSCSKSYLSRIIAEDEVTINYNHDYTAEADFVSFDKEPKPINSKSALFPGIIALRTSNEQNLCKLTHKNGDIIQAKQISIDTITKQIGCAFTHGTILTQRIADEVNGEKIDFQSDILTWNDQMQQLLLKDHVIVEQKGFFLLKNEDEIKISCSTSNQKRQLSTIESNGKTVLTAFSKDDKKEHHLICYGKTIVDHPQLSIYMESPLGIDQKVVQNQQVFFEDDLGQIYADRLSFEYKMENKSLSPKKLILEGHVKMLNSYAAAGADPASPLIRYALADKVEYDPKTKEVLFSSNGNHKRVLFYDKANDMEVSAKILKIKRDEAAKKETIKGLGDVRFSFIENEFEQIKSHFSLDKCKDKNKNVTK